MEGFESRRKDLEEMPILNQCVKSSSQTEKSLAERASSGDESDELILTMGCLLDLMHQVWNLNSSLIKNVKIMIGFIQSYMSSQRKIDPNTPRMKEAKLMKNMLITLLESWKSKKKGSLNSACSLEEVENFLRENKKLFIEFTEDIMSEDSFFVWLTDFKEIFKRQSVEPVNVSTFTSNAMEYTVDHGDSTSSPEVTAKKGGVAMLFGSISTQNETDGVSQYISKLDDDRLHTVRSPGETGHMLIRLDVYDVKDIKNIEKRQWWKHAKMRTQFLTSSPTDCKQQYVNYLLDHVADDLRKISGVTKEITRLY